VEWVFLSPRKCHDISPDTIAKLLESKVATIKCVKQNSSIPVPEVFHYRYIIGIHTRLLFLTIVKVLLHLI
jgi:hypothetical protein